VEVGLLRRKARTGGVSWHAILPLLVVAFLLAPVSTAWGSCPGGSLHVCDSGDSGNPDQLRQVLTNAAPGTTVIIDAGTNPTLSMGTEIPVDKDLTIQGLGIPRPEIAGSATGRVFNIGSVMPTATVTLSDLTISGGRAPEGAAAIGNSGAGGSGADGGGILNAATLLLDGVAMTDNRAGAGAAGNGGGFGGAHGAPGGAGGSGGSGGAVSSSGALTITDSTLSGNQAGVGGKGGEGGDAAPAGADGGNAGSGGSGGSGGAISSSGTVMITGSTLSDDEAGAGGAGDFGGDRGATGQGGPGGPGGSGGPGGAIASADTLTMANSTLSGNHAGAGGDGELGGIGSGITGAGGSGGSGGAISAMAPAVLAETTVATNHAGAGGITGSIPPFGAPGAPGLGGGIAGSLSLTNTLVASNSLVPAATAGSNCSGSPSDGGHNLSFPAGSGCPGATSTDPLLDPLASNDGPTETIRLGPSSAAIDAVPATGAGCPAADQRGIARPQGIACDIGAYESRAARPVIDSTDPASPANSTAPNVIGRSGEGTVSIFSDAACATTALGSGTHTDFAAPGIAVAVPANATTVLHAQTIGADGTSPCSAGFSYATPVPPGPVGPGPTVTTPGPTGQQAAALKKCKKKKSAKARKSCRKRAKKLPA
jgi:hypothetical protein